MLLLIKPATLNIAAKVFGFAGNFFLKNGLQIRIKKI